MSLINGQPQKMRPWLLGGAFFLLTVLAYLPVFRAGFIWDDDSMINGVVQARDGLRYIWFSTALPDYFPLTSSSLWLEWRLWGGNPLGFHCVNLLLHAAGCLALWRVFLQLKIPAAWLGALLFALHPVNVESVAWIAERKNTLCFFFYSISLFCWLRSDSLAIQPLENSFVPRRWYLFSLIAFLCALLSKTAVVMMPFVLLLLIWWQRGQIKRRDFIRTIPFFALSLVLGLVTLWFQYHRAIGGDPIPDRPVLVKMLSAATAVWFYLGKAIWPGNLSFVYPGWNLNPRSLLTWVPLVALVLTTILLWRYRKKGSRSLLMALAYFLLLLAPVLGFFKIYFQRYAPVADHWQYFALPAVTALVAAGIHTVFHRFRANPKGNLSPPYFGVAGALIVCCAALTWRQTLPYENEEILWRDTLRKNPKAWLACNNLGLARERAGNRAEAVELYRQSLIVQPVQIEAHNNLGSAYFEEGRLEEALAEYRAAFQVNPKNPVTLYNLGNVADRQGHAADAHALYLQALALNSHYVDAHNNLGCLLIIQGKAEEGMTHFREALRIKPNNADTLNNLASTLTEAGKPAEAIPFLNRALQIRPQYPDALYNLANALVLVGQVPDAVKLYAAALRLQPQMPLAEYKFGNALLRLGQNDEASRHFARAVELNPNLAEAHYQLGVLFSANQEMAPAIAHFKEAIRLKPDWLEPLNNLSWILATHADEKYRDGKLALQTAERACALTENKIPALLDTLAAAYAEVHQFDKAVRTATNAIALVSVQDHALAQEIESRVKLYRAEKPFRQ